MSDETIYVIVAISIALFIGILFFVLTCIYYVKKDTKMIIEKMQEYYKTCEHGWYWFWPFVYRRVGYYTTNNAKKTFYLNNGKKVEIKYNIIDVKTYHYTQKPIDRFINEITLLKEDISFDYLKDNLLKIGVELISIRQVMTNYD